MQGGKQQVLRFAQESEVCDDKSEVCFSAISAFSAVQGFHPTYIPIARSIARRHTAQNVLCRVNMMQSTSGR